MKEESEQEKDEMIQKFEDTVNEMGINQEEMQNKALSMFYNAFSNILGKANKTIKLITVLPYFLSSGGIMLISLVSALVLYFIVNKRKVDAFTTQHQMPIEQEKMAPIYGEVAKYIAQGVSEELKDSENNK